ncbi:hypothetical protein D9758_018878 [Tetrapyrgos nigripes]|uniref:Uncharacterized protein n=1 Tax=Tetrapyrgos nigripes TaxID=182062 RepID=A0A8H5F8U9_9AGAR|nr:hypothetical protein D9758_018878 [Tetrapyrgos nigripes]
MLLTLPSTNSITGQHVSEKTSSPGLPYGASTTVVGSKMYLFGGRLVTECRMVSDLYVFDLEMFSWERIQAFPEDDVPKPRYFHSANACETLQLLQINYSSLVVKIFSTHGWMTYAYMIFLPRHGLSDMTILGIAGPTAEEACNHPGPSNSQFRDTPTPTAESTPTDSLIHLPYSAAPTEDHPSDIYLYSNYNSTRERHVEDVAIDEV